MKLFVFFTMAFFLILPSVFAETAEGDVVIINSNKNQSQSVTAPALTPSKANELRRAREDAEVATESHILEKLEAERLKDEQKRVDQLLGGKGQETVVRKPSPSLVETPSKPQWYFGERAFVSLGGGYVNYYGGGNIESTDRPAVFFSLGGYAKKYFIFDFTGYYSKHFVEDTHTLNHYGVDQVSGAFSLKISPLSGQIKPYGGVVGVYTGRRSYLTTPEGEPWEESGRRGSKKWYQAFDVGPTVGVDVALGARLGLNVGLWWLFNVSTEEPDSTNEYEEPLSKQQSIVASANVRFYF